MLQGFTLILVFQLIGETIVELLTLPIPGPVVGMVLLFLFLLLRGATRSLDLCADALLAHMSLLFVPAGVGVILFLPVLAREWPAISLSVIAGTLITIVITGLVMRALAKPTQDHTDQHSPESGR